jgi:uncharacterized protein (DUF983 family)
MEPGRILLRGLRLRCPRCGAGGVFESRWRMRPACRSCKLGFEREPGYFVGAIYLNYAATVAVVVPGFFLLEWLFAPSLAFQLTLWGAVAASMPILFFRLSKGLWLSVGYLLDPEEERDPESASRAQSGMEEKKGSG